MKPRNFPSRVDRRCQRAAERLSKRLTRKNWWLNAPDSKFPSNSLSERHGAPKDWAARKRRLAKEELKALERLQ